MAAIKKAIQRIDKPTPQIGLSIEVVEVSNLQSARYQQLLSQLTEPLQMNQKISTMLQLMARVMPVLYHRHNWSELPANR